MKHPDIHGLFYKLIVIAVLLVIVFFLQSYTVDMAKTFTPESLRLAVTYLAFAFAAIVLLDLAYSHWKRSKAEAQADLRFATIERSISTLKEDIKDLIELTTKTGPIKNFLVSAKTILKEEAAITQGEVWVYTSALSIDITARFVKVIASNVHRGVKYHYLIPDVPDLHGDFDILVTSVRNTNDKYRKQTNEYLSVIWLPPLLSRPGGITVHVQEGTPWILAGFATIPHERWGSDFFIRMDQMYASRALHYLQEIKAEYEARPPQ